MSQGSHTAAQLLKPGFKTQQVFGRALKVVRGTVTDYVGSGTYINLFDAHPPFQIDRNFGVTTRLLHYYDIIGLLKPGNVSQAGYRLNTTDDMKKLSQILFIKTGFFSGGDK